jgi:lysophospholipase L1-like esterase
MPKTAFDRTHLGHKGAEYFARMVEAELNKVLPESGSEFSSDSTGKNAH